MNRKHWLSEYEQKKATIEEAVQVVNSGDWVDFSLGVCAPIELEKALAKRKNELEDVKIRSILDVGPHHCLKADPQGEHLCWNSWHFSGIDRKLSRQAVAYYIPMKFHELPQMIMDNHSDVFMLTAAPMDRHGWFNIGAANAATWACVEKAKTVIVEVNHNVPRVLGGLHESIHINQVDIVCESSNPPVPTLPVRSPSAADWKIASLVMDYLEDGDCIQLGIGGTPNAVGLLIAQSDLKDLGVHTELYGDAYLEMCRQGKITGARKQIDRYKQVFSFVLGSQELYEFVDDNPATISYPVNYVNKPDIIAANDCFIAINGALEVDLFGQICAETIGTQHISGTGGQLDFVEGAYHSKGGKSLTCLSSTYTDKNGVVDSRIKPVLRTGAIATCPRTAAHIIVTEYGTAYLKGKSTWERAEALINIAHPDFRDELIREAEALGIWRKTQRI
ncbi:MAG TPA: butyryl-CoA:acetate CoA-transferase [Syntrophomonadaceae bacterium]|nr:butyryl-CoA:acetate CoA-transferase [Syntrophomonadaceae bacterium]